MREIIEQERDSNRWNNATGEWRKNKGETNTESKKKRKKIFFLHLISILVLSIFLFLFPSSFLKSLSSQMVFFFFSHSIWNWVGFLLKMECPSTLTLRTDIERDLCKAERRMEDHSLCHTILVQYWKRKIL